MNGQPKLLLNYQGVCFYEHIKKALAPFPEIYLSVAKEGNECYSAIPLPQIKDIYSDIGPLGGIYSGLQLCRKADALFVTACDTPLICREAVEEMVKAYEAYREEENIKYTKKQITVAQIEGKVHPLFGIYPKTALPVMEQMISEKNYKMQELLSRANAVRVPLPPKSQVNKNINTLLDYQQLCYPAANEKQQ